MSGTVLYRRQTTVVADNYELILASDGSIIYRGRYFSGYYNIDYSDDGGSTWELGLVSMPDDEDNIVININDDPAGYRDAVRDGDYCIDHELDATGFAGDENVNWENVYKITK
jgi:hypothetical protein